MTNESNLQKSKQGDVVALLRDWIETQIQGIRRSSVPEASRGALNAFEQTLARIEWFINQQWRPEKPDRPGWYWCANSGDYPGQIWIAVLRIDQAPDGSLVACWMPAPGQGAVMSEREFSPEALWCGPLT